MRPTTSRVGRAFNTLELEKKEEIKQGRAIQNPKLPFEFSLVNHGYIVSGFNVHFELYILEIALQCVHRANVEPHQLASVYRSTGTEPNANPLFVDYFQLFHHA